MVASQKVLSLLTVEDKSNKSKSDAMLMLMLGTSSESTLPCLRRCSNSATINTFPGGNLAAVKKATYLFIVYLTTRYNKVSKHFISFTNVKQFLQ